MARWEAVRRLSNLVSYDASGDAGLDRMPPEFVPRLRAAWVALAGEPLSVVRGDPGLSNNRIQRRSVGLLDWDEAHVDVSLLDLGALPPCLTALVDADRLPRDRQVAAAWEIANA